MAEENLRLAERLDDVRGHWKLMVVIVLPILVGAIAYTETLPSEYAATAIVSVEPRSGVGLQGLTGAELVRVEAPKFVAYVTAPATVQTVAGLLHIDPTVLQDSVNASVPTDTGQMSITVTAEQPQEAAAAANELATQAVTFSQSDPLLQVGLVARAVVPQSPSGPPRHLIEAASLVVGIITAFVAVFAVERVRPMIRTEADISEWTSYPVVGRLPIANELRAGDPSEVAGAPISSSFRTLGTNIRATMGKRVERTLLVTSSSAGEGKTSVATGLASAWSDLGMRVLLVDADTHHATPNTYGKDRNAGFAGLLRDDLIFESCVHPGWIEGLWILPTIADPRGPIMIARRFGAVLEQARARFGVVIVDSPPLLETDETRHMATLVDDVLLVVGVGSPANKLIAGIGALETAQARLVGIVVNRVKKGVEVEGYYRSMSTRAERPGQDSHEPL